MCKKGDYKRIKLKGHLFPRRIDTCLVDTIKIINLIPGSKTVASCCGHGVFHPTILLRSTPGTIKDHFTGISIPYKKRRYYNYYIKDTETNLYYIPLVEVYYRSIQEPGIK